MHKKSVFSLPPEIGYDEVRLNAFLLKKFQLTNGPDVTLRLQKRSVDARGKKITVNIEAEAWWQQTAPPLINYRKEYPEVKNAKPVVIVGAGPAGMFAALRLIELGMKPIVIERGKDVRARRRDLAAINKEQVVNPESNYCFGEGGAGTYSDGKLYTRSKKRGDFRRILEIFVAHGATEKILYESHPHIGTNKLPGIVTAIRESIIEAGGEFLFNTRVDDFILKNGEITGVLTHKGEHIEGVAVLLATGHSARDIFHLCEKRGITIENKPFALGVRIEHPQNLIDRIQYHTFPDRGPFLPAAPYSLVSQVGFQGKEKGVFSFCMCPGGFIVPAATSPGEIVVNGMSPSRRNSQYANSGIVVSIDQEDTAPFAMHGELAGLAFQQAIEQKACVVAGNTQQAPAQRITDFVNKKISANLPPTSYQPGLQAASLWDVLPPQIAHRLKYGLLSFGKKMKGYFTEEAQIVGVESRTSSPVRIPRQKETLEHIHTKRLFPCGEGAGFAGGIASAAMDGERCAEMIKQLYG